MRRQKSVTIKYFEIIAPGEDGLCISDVYAASPGFYITGEIECQNH